MGNMGLYNNLFVNDHGDAIHIQPHNDIPKTIDLFFNTVLARDRGIAIQPAYGSTTYRQTVAGNAVFAKDPLTGGNQIHNTVASLDDAAEYLANPHQQLGELDLRPRPASLSGQPLNLSDLRNYSNWNRDFDGYKRDMRMRGAYGSSKSVQGWLPQLGIKPATNSGYDGQNQ